MNIFIPYGYNKAIDSYIGINNVTVSCEIAKENYGLDKLIYCKYYEVRKIIAEKGYGLDILINDDNEEVINASINWLNNHNLTLEEYIQNTVNSGNYNWVLSFNK